MKKYWPLLLMTALLFSCGPKEIIKLKNQSFEEKGLKNTPKSWDFGGWKVTGDYSEYGLTENEAKSGKKSMFIHNKLENHSYFKQKISLPPEKGSYKISVWIKTYEVTGNNGAGVTIDGAITLGGRVTGTMDWKECHFYFRKDKDIRSAVLILSLGHFASLSRGEAWFDDVQIEKINIIPGGQAQGELTNTLPTENEAQPQPPNQKRSDALKKFTIFAILLILGGITLSIIFIKKSIAEKELKPLINSPVILKNVRLLKPSPYRKSKKIILCARHISCRRYKKTRNCEGCGSYRRPSRIRGKFIKK